MRKFSDIIGQKAIIEHLYNALRTGSISHAYILSGDAGSGRKTIASIFAAALQCEDLQEEETEEPEQPVSQASGGLGRPMPGTAGAGGKAAPGAPGAGRQPAPRMRKRKLLESCGRCLSCIQAQSGNQPDIITVSHEKPNSIGVGEIRRMRADLQIKPYSNARKVYIVPDAEKLTIPAQNALLKTLEEPPEYAVIILIANGLSAFLPTILSRCVVLQTRAVEEAQIARFLQREKELPEDQAMILARFAGGNPGQALLLTDDKEFLELRDKTVDFLAHLSRADAVRISEFASDIDAGRRDEVLSFVLMWFRDVLLYHSTQNSENLIFQEDIQYIIEAAGMLGYEQLGMILDEVDLASRRLKSNVAADSVFEVMFLKIRQQYRRRI
jgi:DNA polymerase-3 subunit delta'